MTERKVCIATLGCKLNQSDSDAILASLHASGYRVVMTPDEADLCIVNTCAVTATAERKSRNLLRRFTRTAPQARVVAVGCLAEHNPWALKAIDGVNLILGSREKEHMLDFLSSESASPVAVGEITREQGWLSTHVVGGESGRSRAYLKIQDGCDEKCTYCIVPHLRGRARSRPIEDAIEQAKQLADKGFSECVLTGVNLAAYGQELGLKEGLSVLLSSLEKVSGLRRIRLGSIEPWGLSEPLLRLIAESEKICPHLHLPLQSADDAILHRMNRRYTASHVEELIQFAFSLRSDWGLGADIIVGFPGETEEHFARTQRFLERHPFNYLHLFPFSVRPGTPAERLPDRVSTMEIRRRVNELKRLDEEKRHRFRQKYLDTVQQVIPEGTKNGALAMGLTHNYLRVFFEPSGSTPKAICEVHIEKLHPKGVQGRIIGVK
jgi:threonylcarbamoyladenosine tRNA methylthiotransferase MtaB